MLLPCGARDFLGTPLDVLGFLDPRGRSGESRWGLSCILHPAWWPGCSTLCNGLRAEASSPLACFALPLVQGGHAQPHHPGALQPAQRAVPYDCGRPLPALPLRHCLAPRRGGPGRGEAAQGRAEQAGLGSRSLGLGGCARLWGGSTIQARPGSLNIITPTTPSNLASPACYGSLCPRLLVSTERQGWHAPPLPPPAPHAPALCSP